LFRLAGISFPSSAVRPPYGTGWISPSASVGAQTASVLIQINTADLAASWPTLLDRLGIDQQSQVEVQSKNSGKMRGKRQ
jgi:hypothetical protein